jgi:hypothetical protein
VQKTETVKESIQGELNLKNQIAKKNEDLVKQQEIELRKLTVSSAAVTLRSISTIACILFCV